MRITLWMRWSRIVCRSNFAVCRICKSTRWAHANLHPSHPISIWTFQSSYLSKRISNGPWQLRSCSKRRKSCSLILRIPNSRSTRNQRGHNVHLNSPLNWFQHTYRSRHRKQFTNSYRELLQRPLFACPLGYTGTSVKHRESRFNWLQSDASNALN